uniref:Protein Flattop n=1 Tax=Anas platyrhynchos TaxID=8839 RepID=A0A8B9T1I0_ANAPL
LSAAPLPPQYEDAFSAARLQNWERPTPRDGSTQILVNDRGHLLPSVPRSQASPWGSFLGTWDMPSRIPPAKLNLTARSGPRRRPPHRLPPRLHRPHRSLQRAPGRGHRQAPQNPPLLPSAPLTPLRHPKSFLGRMKRASKEPSRTGRGSGGGPRSSPQPGLGDPGGVAAPQTPASVTAREATPQGKGSGSPQPGDLSSSAPIPQLQ